MSESDMAPAQPGDGWIFIVMPNLGKIGRIRESRPYGLQSLLQVAMAITMGT